MWIFNLIYNFIISQNVKVNGTLKPTMYNNVIYHSQHREIKEKESTLGDTL